MLTDQQWVILDNLEVTKTVYIFRSNKILLISRNGIIEKAKWEYLNNNSLLIHKEKESYLFKHGFFDEHILALKIDGKNEYVFLINENQFNGDINSIESVFRFLSEKYLRKTKINKQVPVESKEQKEPQYVLMKHISDKGILEIEQVHDLYSDFVLGSRVYMDGSCAQDGKYKLGFMWYVHVKNGKIKRASLF